MAYSITPVLHHYADKNGLYKIYIQVIVNRMIVRVTTHYKVQANQFKDREVISHPNKSSINGNLRNEINDIESRLHDHFRAGATMVKADLDRIVNNRQPEASKVQFTQFIKSYVDETTGKKALTTNRGYLSIIPDIDSYARDLPISSVNQSWLNLYEKHQRSLGWDGNTVHKKMVRIKTMLNRAADAGLIEKSRFDKYKVPVYIQKIPEYISEQEMQAVKDLADSIKMPNYKMAAYYFLLACYAGYRLSDLQKFSYAKFVKQEKILLRAKKNKEIVLMPLYTRLIEILEYVKDNPLTIVEQNMREYMKEISKLAGINRHIKIHTGRHSFAMMLMDNGFEISDVATLLGVSEKTATIYGRISNQRLEKKVRNKLG